MVLEIADLSILPGKNAEFELAIAAGVKEVISKAKGFIGKGAIRIKVCNSSLFGLGKSAAQRTHPEGIF
jgi:hypothetical protein